MAKRKSQSADVALPGLESVVMPLDVRPASKDMSDAKTFTAAVLFRDHPRVFRSACELLFRNGLSARSVAAALYLSVNTVRAIRDMVLASDGRTVDAAAAAFFDIKGEGIEKKEENFAAEVAAQIAGAK